MPEGGASEVPKPSPSIFGTGENFFMLFSPNGRSSKLDFNDVQLMTESELGIKMAAIYQKLVWQTWVSASIIQGANVNPMQNQTGIFGIKELNGTDEKPCSILA